jgi:hypothetical protein
MNIFVLDNSIQKSARYHNDKHIVKMVVEIVQMMSTTNRLNGLEEGYKITHKNHPCSVWMRESLSNWLYAKELVNELNKEWKFRYNHTRNHKSYEVAMSLSKPNVQDIGITTFAQAMPDTYKNEDIVLAYRNYYIGDKQHLAKWTKREIPDWFVKNEN